MQPGDGSTGPRSRSLAAIEVGLSDMPSTTPLHSSAGALIAQACAQNVHVSSGIFGNRETPSILSGDAWGSHGMQVQQVC